MGRILVGVDGSRAAEAAVQWALDHASSGDTVVLCHAWSLPVTMGIEGPIFSMSEIEAGAKQLVEDMAESIRVDNDDITIETEVVYGHPGSTLIERSDGIDFLVVGSRGYGGFKGLLLGSVSTYIVHHTTCPVVVVPAPEAN
ncbi:MAG: universal stress protein [Acidimicrobiia bacterium]|nr:universal stress protein [Acidimicrobiia bacterium]